MKCPNCKNPLKAYNWDSRTGINKVSYTCTVCKKVFERHTFFDITGLVKDDKIYEINEDGYIAREWL